MFKHIGGPGFWHGFLGFLTAIAPQLFAGMLHMSTTTAMIVGAAGSALSSVGSAAVAHAQGTAEATSNAADNQTGTGS